MKLYYYVLIVCMYMQCGFAHDSDKAFYKIIVKDTVVEVKAEFPWTIRKAFLKAFPEFSKSKNKQKFEKSFFEYIKKNFQIHNSEIPLELIVVRKGISEGHSHQNDYVFVFKGNDFDIVTNTLMCNLSKTHKNYHKFQQENIINEYITTNSSPSFKIDNSKSMAVNKNKDKIVPNTKKEIPHRKQEDEIVYNRIYYVLGLFVIILVSFGYYRIRNRK